MIRILMLNCEFPPIGGGAANMNWYFLKEVAKHHDVELDLITSGVNHTSISHDFGSNINIRKVNVWKKNLHHWTFREMLVYLIKAYFLAFKLVLKNKYDLIHAVFGFPSGLIAYLLRKKVPYVVSMRGSDVPMFNSRFSFGYKLIRPLIKKIWASASALTANSKGLKELALLTDPQINIRIIPNGVDNDEFSPFVAEPGNGTRLLTVARLIDRKGIDYLIKSLSDLKDIIPGISLTIVGSGDKQNELEALVKKRELSESVKFLGEVPHNELAAIYSSHDVFVLPSFNEGMSNAMLEAMASGLPIVTTATGGTSELLNGNAVIIEKGSSDSIRDALRTIISDKDKLSEMKRLSLERSKDFSWSKTAQEYFNFYDEAIKVH